MESMGHLKQESSISLSEKSIHPPAAGRMLTKVPDTVLLVVQYVCVTGYVEDMKMEMQKIRVENRRLGQQIEELSTVNRELMMHDDETSRRRNPEGPLMRAHVRAMNETIG